MQVVIDVSVYEISFVHVLLKSVLDGQAVNPSANVEPGGRVGDVLLIPCQFSHC
jgi:hypothetical protein